MADEIKSSVDVYYGEQLIGIVSHGETGDIDCKGREMLEDIRIKVPHDMKAVKYQDKRFTINKNGKHTMYPDEGYVMGAAILEVEVPGDNIWLGEFDPDYPYRVGSIVSQNNMVYVCIVKPTDNQPPTDTTYWELLSGKIQDEKIVDIITHGKLEFEPDEGYVAVRKLIANVANITADATATEEDVIYGKTFYAGGESKAGAMKIVDSSTFSSLALQNVAEGKLEVQYYADKNAYLLNNKGQTRPGTIGTIVEPKFKAENIAEGVTLFGVSGKHGSTPIFDGTINIESSLTTISGCYIIDEQKAFDLLSTYGKVKTFNVKFGAGGPANGGDEIGFTSMTFDGTYGFIKYNDKAAFAMNGGFAEYNNNYGDGNGARVNFEEGTECRKEFKELFLSIADEYVEPELQEELQGTWLFNNNIVMPPTYIHDTYSAWNFNFSANWSGDNTSFYSLMVGDAYNTGKNSVDFCWDIDDMDWTTFWRSDIGFGSINKTIEITSSSSQVENVTSLLTWLKANATKQ